MTGMPAVSGAARKQIEVGEIVRIDERELEPGGRKEDRGRNLPAS